MPTKLRNVEVREASLVDNPANPKARVVLFKAEKPMKTEGGESYPAEAYAHVPDAETPSTWKLRMWETPEKKETAAQIGRAVAALGPSGFRGNRVEIPAEDLPNVKRRILTAWRKTHPDAPEDEIPNVLKGRDSTAEGFVSRMLRAIGKGLGWSPEEVEKAEHEATTFAEELDEERNRKVESEVWNYVYALSGAISSTLRDQSVDREALIRGSLDQFTASIEAALPSWLQGNVVEKVGRAISAERAVRLKEMRDMLTAMIAETEPKPKKESDENMIDKAKLEADVRQHIEDLEKRAETAEQELAKAKQPPVVEDLLKGVSEPLRKRMEDLEKRAEEAEKVAKAEHDARVTKEFIEKAAGYSHLPMKAEEFGPVLKALAEKAPDEFAKIEAVLKTAEEQVATANLFGEAGRSGGAVGADTFAKIETVAKGLVEKGLAKTMPEAIAKAAEMHPDLYHEYRAELRKGAN